MTTYDWHENTDIVCCCFFVLFFIYLFIFLLRIAYTSAATQLKMYAICAHCPINGTTSARIDPDEIQQNAASHQGLYYLLS